MRITHQPTTTRLLATFLVLSWAVPALAFTFWFTSPPTQCANTTVQWGGGRPPFTLLLVPTGSITPETRLIQEFTINSGFSTSFVLNFPARSRFVAVMNDASGVGVGGTSRITTVASSDTTSCLNTNPTAPKFYFHLSPTDIAQCASIDISWDSRANPPVEVLALIPGGQSFEVANVADGGNQVRWQADVREGSGLVLVAGDSDGLGTGGSTDVISVGPGDSSCIDSDSPGTTPGQPAGGLSTGVPGGEQTGGSGDGTNPTATDSAGNPITTGPGASGTQGTGQPGQTGGSGNGNGDGGNGGDGNDGGNGGGNGSPTFPGSGGGTVTGNPGDEEHSDNNLPLILGLVLGTLGLISLILGGIVVRRRYKQRRAAAYANLDLAQPATSAPPSIASFPGAWQNWRRRSYATPGSRPGSRRWLSFNWAAHLRGGAPSSGRESTETLPSMFQTEPFIIPPPPFPVLMSGEHDDPFTPPPLGVYYDSPYAPRSARRPNMTAMSRQSSSGSLRSFLEGIPHARDASILDVDDTRESIVAGVHDHPDQNREHPSAGFAPAPLQLHTQTPADSGAVASSSEKHALLERDRRERDRSLAPVAPIPRRAPNGRHRIVIPSNPLPPPAPVVSPTRVTRDSEDFSPEPEEASPNPFGEEVLEIPPTYHSLRAVSMQGRLDPPEQGQVHGHGHGVELLVDPASESMQTVPGTGGPPAGPTDAGLSRSNALNLSRTSQSRAMSTTAGSTTEGSRGHSSADASAGH